MLGLLAEKFIENPDTLRRLKELISVGVIFDMIREDARNDKAIEIARKLLRRGISVLAVAEDTGLTESTVRDLKADLDKESEQGTTAVV